MVNNLTFQWELIRRSMAEWQAARPGRGDARPLAVPRRVDAGVQGPLRRAPEHDQQRQVRGYLGQRTPRRIRLRNIR